MSLSVYNSLTRRQEAFETVEPGKVKMYYCGVTVYDYCHLGHARACIVWDVVRRYLDFRGYQVRYVQNFTDIDDKILNRARKEDSSMKAVAEKYIDAYFEDMARLNVKEADEYPRATHTMNGIQRLIHDLEHKGYAYPSEGDVYYAVRQFSDYGKLSGRKLEDLQAGASERVDVKNTEYQKKKDPFDFALWKAAKEGEPAWESPWGKGRPGWHIECSAMVRDRLGDTIDIHAGGEDLIFPHHENEIAQSEAVTGQDLSRYWMHNGMVKVNGEKMSKSLGNFITIRELLDKGVDSMALRLLVLQTQYRKPIDFSDRAIAGATNGWHTLKEGLIFGERYGKKLGWKEENTSSPISEAVERFKETVDNDFNFPGGLVILFELAKDLGREGNIIVHEGKTLTASEKLKQQWQTLVTLAGVLGLEAESVATTNEVNNTESGNNNSNVLSDADIEELIQRRKEARTAKDFAQADRIRDQLQAQGVALIDSKEGTRWHRS
ncbi:cysteine--tRNA ligase [Mastigocoleus testarum]|uniref:Cysteine--tRNA ligase n=1 Tax=Mastigocoleus testarum BC008 TaxID=371196 RepID=A0A0V7ZPD2_9CYAN|nr:cysteine--tRNA ligase [Mastigocoleus testarum]KST66413.1 cysteine--tRNA ligase [Mastigocoleus testarum BC008]